MGQSRHLPCSRGRASLHGHFLLLILGHRSHEHHCLGVRRQSSGARLERCRGSRLRYCCFYLCGTLRLPLRPSWTIYAPWVAYSLSLFTLHLLIFVRGSRLTAMARATFGLYGSYLPVLLLVFENIIFVSCHNAKAALVQADWSSWT